MNQPVRLAAVASLPGAEVLTGERVAPSLLKMRSAQGAGAASPENVAFAKTLGPANAWLILSGNDCYSEHYAMDAAHVAMQKDASPVVTMLPSPIMDNTHPLLVNSSQVSAGHCSIQYTRRAGAHPFNE